MRTPVSVASAVVVPEEADPARELDREPRVRVVEVELQGGLDVPDPVRDGVRVEGELLGRPGRGVSVPEVGEQGAHGGARLFRAPHIERTEHVEEELAGDRRGVEVEEHPAQARDVGYLDVTDPSRRHRRLRSNARLCGGAAQTLRAALWSAEAQRDVPVAPAEHLRLVSDRRTRLPDPALVVAGTSLLGHDDEGIVMDEGDVPQLGSLLEHLEGEQLESGLERLRQVHGRRLRVCEREPRDAVDELERHTELVRAVRQRIEAGRFRDDELCDELAGGLPRGEAVLDSLEEDSREHRRDPRECESRRIVGCIAVDLEAEPTAGHVSDEDRGGLGPSHERVELEGDGPTERLRCGCRARSRPDSSPCRRRYCAAPSAC